MDTLHKKVAVGMTYPNVNVTFLDFEQIIDCKITENSNIISGGGLGRAVAGGVIAGGVGAIVGANTKKVAQCQIISQLILLQMILIIVWFDLK